MPFTGVRRTSWSRYRSAPARAIPGRRLRRCSRCQRRSNGRPRRRLITPSRSKRYSVQLYQARRRFVLKTARLRPARRSLSHRHRRSGGGQAPVVTCARWREPTPPGLRPVIAAAAADAMCRLVRRPDTPVKSPGAAPPLAGLHHPSATGPRSPPARWPISKGANTGISTPSCRSQLQGSGTTPGH